MKLGNVIIKEKDYFDQLGKNHKGEKFDFSKNTFSKRLIEISFWLSLNNIDCYFHIEFLKLN